MYMIKKASEISGVSVRMLHYYDEIGLLSPQKSENGYRYYTEAEMACLQVILFYKYLGFSLKQIKFLMTKDDIEILNHLKKQLILMKKENENRLTLIETLQKTIDYEERKITMSTKEKFRGFVYQDHQKYKEMAIDKYGKDVVEKSMEKQKGKEQELTEKFNQIFALFAENKVKGLKTTSKENIELSQRLHDLICQYSFDCSFEVFSSIGYGYKENPEFKTNIDRFGMGTAEYACDAIQKYVNGVK
ncbi:MerR family transcriptional regulator [Facklamia miroungae]|uniref:DNA-binding transcriptional regulator, MerR family n=1 Tax=Facklamia miroungae TaxID=120956 RepID=A0A1G7UB56_9LACT|nr:MerR family transcriptional regulator [Facklamia miroungae]NKZ30033.1 MerR family transcriptional regulator [Facklamia miroungae]SDG44608.1 DNA-binding transcriptional regulator, MerR family [Facklamia miroungae]